MSVYLEQSLYHYVRRVRGVPDRDTYSARASNGFESEVPIEWNQKFVEILVRSTRVKMPTNPSKISTPPTTLAIASYYVLEEQDL